VRLSFGIVLLLDTLEGEKSRDHERCFITIEHLTAMCVEQRCTRQWISVRFNPEIVLILDATAGMQV
jgi:hypothetical protein